MLDQHPFAAAKQTLLALHAKPVLTVQEATVAALEDLSDPAQRIVVDAFLVPVPTIELCSEDTLHGPGMVQIALSDGAFTDIHELCLACGIAVVEQLIADRGSETHIDVEVTQ